MKRINDVKLSGYIHYKKVAKTQKGDTKLSFSLNVFRNKPEGGNAVYDYVQCVCYGDVADKLDMLDDGAECVVIGEWRHETYQDRNGDKKSIDYVRVDDGFTEVKAPKIEEPAEEDVGDDWLPF